MVRETSVFRKSVVPHNNTANFLFVVILLGLAVRTLTLWAFGGFCSTTNVSLILVMLRLLSSDSVNVLSRLHSATVLALLCSVP
jgi:hypothetical protein